MTSLEGKVALVTGAGSGIGRATALTFAREGAAVAVADIDEAGAEETVSLIEAAGGQAAPFSVDVTDEASVEAMVAGVVDQFGGLDAAHNNAGIAGPLAPTADLSTADFRRLLDVNVVGVFLCLKHEIPRMIERGAGAIVNTSSGAGLRGVPFLPGYATTKHAVLGLTRSAAHEYAAQGIRVNAVCPGPISTPMLDTITADNENLRTMFSSNVPMRREGTPDEVAELVMWLCSPAASYMNGAAVSVDGGSLA